MKNKKIATYLLFATAIIIWGTITWRLVKAFKKEEIVAQTTRPLPVVHKPDSVVLLLNYDDPFLKDTVGKNVSGEEESGNPGIEFYPQEPELVQGPAFKFKGILKAGKKSYGLLDLAGETIMVSARERVGDFYVVSITADKIVVRRQGLDMELFAE
ncbi:hypothetical protein [Proteiniphilum sp. X52]|uniref:hypothetical protein n=1 Tax=Proteiniphilum sp. X52 TaxID=2382159 RepID=UPI000F0A3EFF|nr:hypothetical protein [Proteiniphilum sp. X52]RNC63887.1 hypothetical protein D7D25_14355 [Proteiniphilum sp. X52]